MPSPSLISLVVEWLQSPQFDNHFILQTADNPTTTYFICCRCPSFWDKESPGVGFIWFNDTKISARPLKFYSASGPETLTDISNPECFHIIEERLMYLHDFFKDDRRHIHG